MLMHERSVSIPAVCSEVPFQPIDVSVVQHDLLFFARVGSGPPVFKLDGQWSAYRLGFAHLPPSNHLVDIWVGVVYLGAVPETSTMSSSWQFGCEYRMSGNNSFNALATRFQTKDLVLLWWRRMVKYSKLGCHFPLWYGCALFRRNLSIRCRLDCEGSRALITHLVSKGVTLGCIKLIPPCLGLATLNPSHLHVWSLKWSSCKVVP